MAKSLEQRIEEQKEKLAAMEQQKRERDKRERARADAALLRAVKDVFGDGVTAEHIRQRFGKREQTETHQPSEQRKDG